MPVVLQCRPAMTSSTDAPQGADFVGLGGDHRLLEVMKQLLSLRHRQPYQFGIERLAWPVDATQLDRIYFTPVGNQFDANDDFHRGPRRRHWRGSMLELPKTPRFLTVPNGCSKDLDNFEARVAWPMSHLSNELFSLERGRVRDSKYSVGARDCSILWFRSCPRERA